MLTPFIKRTTDEQATGQPVVMEMGSAQEFGLVLTLLALALLAGLIFDAMALSLLLAVLIWLGVQIRQFRRVYRWSRRPWRRPRNGFDSWFNLAYRPYRALMRERVRSRQVTARLRQILDLVELIPDGVIVLSANGEIEGMNNAATRILQIGDNDVGLVLSTLVRSPDFVSFIRSKEVSEEPQILEFTSPVNPDHTLEARRFKIEDGGQILLLRDITTLNRLLTVRQNFVANVSHELRTPLAVIQGYMETITSEEEDSEMRLALTSRLVNPLSRMQSLVNDLLLLTRLESTESEDHASQVELASVVRNAVAGLGDLNDARQRVQISSEGDVHITGSVSELHSLCVNLISNALRYSSEGQPVEVSVQRTEDSVRLAVRDYGVGIAPEHLERLTERFYRVDMADSRTRGGTGLGLAIVKHVLRRHNSALQIESELGQGSVFSCEFAPSEASTSESAASAAAPSEKL